MCFHLKLLRCHVNEYFRGVSKLLMTTGRVWVVVFEELVMMKSAWGSDLYDAARVNTDQIEEVSVLEYEQILLDDAESLVWDNGSEPDLELII
jgi:hypothetical protein